MTATLMTTFNSEYATADFLSAIILEDGRVGFALPIVDLVSDMFPAGMQTLIIDGDMIDAVNGKDLHWSVVKGDWRHVDAAVKFNQKARREGAHYGLPKKIIID
tara:strand:+ start:394 stop:705 length:312 start_codon:yes stop_codon:yes gene_type:complete